MKKQCKDFTVKIAGYVDGELSDRESNAIAEHLKACPACKEQYVSEKRIKKLLRERLAEVKAPQHLQARVRRQLERYGERPGFWRLLNSVFEYRPLATSFALAVIALLVILPSVQVMRYVSDIDAVREETYAVQMRGEIICLDCEFLSKKNAGVKHDIVTHRAGLRAEDKTIWTFLLTDKHKELFKNPELLFKKAQVSGIVFANSRYIQIEDYRLL